MEVAIWQEAIIIPTYEAGKPDKNPMFFEKRVYQGSSGAVYPNPVIESISDEKTDKAYKALFLENKYLKIMILPELGGRIQMAFDKIANRHFIYYNQVVKPALVGLCGPWISGGIEFNWPQHHRPSTFEPVDYMMENNDDGSKTVWVNEVERMFHTKGMAGFTLHPDKAYLEIKAKIYNRTSLPQTFLWWANPAVKVNDDYQSVFPPDVNAVFDHGKRDVSTFPIATGTYYKVDYSPGTDISRYRNIPVPTSYMAVNSKYDFVGGYEHDTKAGVLHIADHHVSPGKKQWTWGNGDFGIAWDRNLTDEDGPYIELMTGVFTDNQPDFSWLMPYEEKSFTQYFLPYRELGLVKSATQDLLAGLHVESGTLALRIFATSTQYNLRVILTRGEEGLIDSTVDISPESPYTRETAYGGKETSLLLMVINETGEELLKYDPAHDPDTEIPNPAKPAVEPTQVGTNEELFLIGQHLEQYRHATYNPVSYYEEALKRDAGDIRNNNALGKWYLRRGRFDIAEKYLRKAVATIISRNPNPYDGEPYYDLGLSLFYQSKLDEAYEGFFKSTWSSAWQDSGYYSVAQIDVTRKHFTRALEHINWSIDRNARNGKAYVLKSLALRKLGKNNQAIETARAALLRDAFNIGAQFELSFAFGASNDSFSSARHRAEAIELSRNEAHTLVDYAIDYLSMNAFAEAIEVLKTVTESENPDAMACYYRAFAEGMCGDASIAHDWYGIAASAHSGIHFVNRLEDIHILSCAAACNSSDAKAWYLLGNLWYDKRQYDLAISAWETATNVDPALPTPYRNLAIAVFNKLGDPLRAMELFETAYTLDPSDARVLMEYDQLKKRQKVAPAARLGFLLDHVNVVNQRDDLYLEIAAIKNFLGRYNEAFEAITARKFHPWEGGEGKVSGQYIYSLVEIAKRDIKHGHFQSAIEKLVQAQTYPETLGEGKLPGAQENDIFYWLGCAFDALGDSENAGSFWRKASSGSSEPSAAIFYNDQQPDKIFYQGLAWRKLGDNEKAEAVFSNLVNYGNKHIDDEVKIDYFAVSLPDLLIFDADQNEQNRTHCNYVAGLGYLGLQEMGKAEERFVAVLQADTMHFGALTHLQLLQAAGNRVATAN